MKVNYHSHTWRCKHADGTEREMVEKAIERGIQILGFSDHGPQIFPGDYYSNFRMRPEELGDYVNTILNLRREYSDKIQIHLGLEMEYYPNRIKDTVAFLKDYPIEYMLLGQHYLGDEEGEENVGIPTDSREYLRRYCFQVAQGMNSGLFTYVAHPDMVNFIGDEGFYRQQMRALCKEANSCGLPLEVNLLGVGAKRQYPNEIFWQEAAQENCRVVIGRDAHSPSHFDKMAAWERGMEIVKKYDLDFCEQVQLRPIK